MNSERKGFHFATGDKIMCTKNASTKVLKPKNGDDKSVNVDGDRNAWKVRDDRLMNGMVFMIVGVSLRS